MIKISQDLEDTIHELEYLQHEIEKMIKSVERDTKILIAVISGYAGFVIGVIVGSFL